MDGALPCARFHVTFEGKRDRPHDDDHQPQGHVIHQAYGHALLATRAPDPGRGLARSHRPMDVEIPRPSLASLCDSPRRYVQEPTPWIRSTQRTWLPPAFSREKTLIHLPVRGSLPRWSIYKDWSSHSPLLPRIFGGWGLAVTRRTISSGTGAWTPGGPAIVIPIPTWARPSGPPGTGSRTGRSRRLNSRRT